MTIDNTDLTSGGIGQGSDDGDDVIGLTVEVLDHAEASLSAVENADALVIEFGQIVGGGGVETRSFDVFNLESAPGLTAALRLIGVTGAGDTGLLFSDVELFDDLAAGQGRAFTAFFDTNVGEGTYEAVYQLDVSDENLPGGQPGATLTVTLRGTVQPDVVPIASSWGMVIASVVLLAAATFALRGRFRARAHRLAWDRQLGH